jgi:predicted transcriptional regulator
LTFSAALLLARSLSSDLWETFPTGSSFRSVRSPFRSFARSRSTANISSNSLTIWPGRFVALPVELDNRLAFGQLVDELRVPNRNLVEAADLGVSQDTVYRAKQHHRENGKLTQVGELSTEEKRAEDRVVEDTQAEIAADLGVSQYLISQAIDEVGGNDIVPNKLSTEEKRAEVREYVEANPTASDREVAEKLGVSQPLVSKVCNRINGNIITHDRVKARASWRFRSSSVSGSVKSRRTSAWRPSRPSKYGIW